MAAGDQADKRGIGRQEPSCFCYTWGLDTPRYKAGMYLKQDLYMHAGKKLISLYPEDKPRLHTVLTAKLSSLGWHLKTRPSP